MQKTAINPEILQQSFEASANAAQKGQSQFFTPIDFGRKIAEALPRFRTSIVDLNCGAGHLLQASALPGTLRLLGADIDPCRGSQLPPAAASFHRITSCITKTYPLLKEVDFRADLHVLNPPWGLELFRAPLSLLADSDLPAVRLTWKAFDGKETIDSTLAMLLIALDTCTSYGEGLCIANHATLERLIFGGQSGSDTGAPGAALAQHVWARLLVPGNPMTGRADCNFEAAPFTTEVLYFARSHTNGPRTVHWPELPNRLSRAGAELRNEYGACESTAERWVAVRERVGELHGNKPKVPWNIYLRDHLIRTDLSLFERSQVSLKKADVQRLFELNGKAPMSLVLQRAERDLLLSLVRPGSPWRVQPELLAAVEAAVVAYNAERAPLYPLPEMQRLGYLDEEDSLTCTQDLGTFRAGRTYPLRTQSVKVVRQVERPNSMTGEPESLEYTGQELAILLKVPGQEAEACFMDARLRDDPTCEIDNPKEKAPPSGPGKKPCPIDFTLQDLVRSFLIPEVPDVATVNPAAFQNNLALLAELESACA